MRKSEKIEQRKIKKNENRLMISWEVWEKNEKLEEEETEKEEELARKKQK